MEGCCCCCCCCANSSRGSGSTEFFSTSRRDSVSIFGASCLRGGSGGLEFATRFSVDCTGAETRGGGGRGGGGLRWVAEVMERGGGGGGGGRFPTSLIASMIDMHNKEARKTPPILSRYLLRSEHLVAEDTGCRERYDSDLRDLPCRCLHF